MSMALHFGDCLYIMDLLPERSVDLVLADLPYGTTYATWDKEIPAEQLWTALLPIVRDKAAMIFTSSQPFTSALVSSAPHLFRAEWIWDKVNGANFANANRQPLKVHENILVFATGQTIYNPIKVVGRPNHKQGLSQRKHSDLQLIDRRGPDDLSGMKFPRSIQVFPKHSSQSGLHPTQKPLALMEYLIRTYSNEGDTVLDPTMGSGTTGLACLNTGRRFIGIESDQTYYKTACDRLGYAVP